MNAPDLSMILQGEDGSYAGDGKDGATAAYQSEEQLEKHLVDILASQGYEYLPEIKSEEEMQDNLRTCMEKLNRDKLQDGCFTDGEWKRFFDEVVANKSEGLLEKTKKLRQSHSFLLDSGEKRNLRLLSPDPADNTLQVVNQIERKAGSNVNRYDVTLLVNGLPLLHIELKRRGVALREAFNQVNRYRRESFWSEGGLFNYVQLFVISNGTQTRYYSNTVRELSRTNQEGHTVTQWKTFAYQFTSTWAEADNKAILDLDDFARSFLERRQLTRMLWRYCVLGADNIQRALRPYQIHAVEAIEKRIMLSRNKAGSTDAGGYIWHTTGSGKTLTSFVTATLLSEDPEIEKVLFVVDRKDLDYQTMLEFNKFAPGSVDGTNNTKQLEQQLHSESNKIIVTTIQKLDRYTRNNKDSDLKKKRVVLIFDECHRSQFGVFHQNITRFFGPYHIFGFTGTPIFAKNAAKGSSATISKNGEGQIGTTEAVFGDKLHYYTIVSAINDKNVLPFKVDYVNTIKEREGMDDTEEVSSIDTREALESPERVSEVVAYILRHHDSKTRRRRFNAILATASVEMAQKYYSEIKRQQAKLTDPASSKYDPSFKPLRVATIYSYAANDADGSDDGDINSIDDEVLENTSGLPRAARDQLQEAIDDYNKMFKTNYDAGSGFQDYYKDLSRRMKSHKDERGNVPFDIDLLIVVNMFLTGYDAQTLNTLYVDKNLRLHGLLQSFSRTNRILNSEKSHGEIVCFRNLSDRVDESISLFGDEEASGIVLLRPYREYLEKYKELVKKLEKMEPVEDLVKESDKREFIKVWGDLLKTHNVLKTFDQYDTETAKISERQMQDGNSFYLELRDQFTDDKTGESILDDIIFETELVKSVEVDIDYILSLIERYHESNTKDKKMRDTITKSIEASPSLRNKKELLERFISQVNQGDDIHSEFDSFVSSEATKELDEIIESNNLSPSKTRNLVNRSFKDREFVAEGTTITNLNDGDVIGFGDARNQWKEKIYSLLVGFFEKYVDLDLKDRV